MVKTVLKSITVSLTAALLLTACSSDQEKVTTPKVKASKVVEDRGMAADATSSEVKKHDEYVAHIKKVKKKKKVQLKKLKVDLKKFCFKDNHSIHYKFEERCK